MELVVLGCHGGETPKHRTSSFLVDEHLAIDAGAVTSMLSLEDQKKIRHVLVSHSHMDHVRDLATLADNRCQQAGPPIEIVGTPETIGTLQRYFFNDKLWPDFSKILTPEGPTVRFRQVAAEESIEVGNYRVTPVLVNHTVETAAFILRGPSGSLAYSGDTGPTDRLWQLLEGVEDLRALLMEVSFPNEQHCLAKTPEAHTHENRTAAPRNHPGQQH